jgi:hypothetical protein
MDWIDLAQDGDQWRTVVNTVMNLRVHRMSVSSSQEGLSFMRLSVDQKK